MEVPIGRGASRQCKICNDGKIIKTSIWTSHWKRNHSNIYNAKFSYTSIGEESKGESKENYV
jgi:hypothetical protein